MFTALKRTVEHREDGWEEGYYDIELLRKLSLCFKIVEKVGEHCCEISLEKCAMHLKLLRRLSVMM